MNSKDNILQRLRRYSGAAYDMPDLSFKKKEYADPVEEFRNAASTFVGARVMDMAPDGDINALIAEAYPDAKIIASTMPEVKAQLNPDTVERAQDLDGADVGVIQGTVACAENGCIWIPQTMKQRAVCFIPEYLVIVIDAKDIVSNMHQAYSRVQMPENGSATFISGPSKTADIEQALVYGAQASRGVTIIIKS